MSAETKSGGLPHKYLLHTIIMVVITFGFRLLPCPGSVTPYGMAVLGVFIGLVYGWTFLGLLGPSLFGAIVMGTTDYGSVQDVFVAMFSNSTVLMMLVGILAFAAIEQTGAGDWLVAKLLNSKIAKKSPIFIVEIFLFIFYLGNIIGLCWFLYFAMLPLCAEMLLKCGYEKGDRFNFFFLAGCLIFGQIGMTLFPFLGWSLMTVGTMMQLTQTMISYPQYMAIMAIFGILSFITYPFLMKICGCKFDKLATVDIQTAFPNVKADAKLTVSQNLSIWSVVLFVVFVIAASMFGKNIAFLSYINTKIGVLGLMVILWVFIIMFQTNGKPLLDMRKAAAGFSWDMLILIAVALFISSALTQQETGISAWIAGLLGPIFAKTSPIVFLIALGILTAVITNIGNNVALCFVMINIVCAMYLNGFPVNITAAAVIISLTSVFVAILTPAASICGALLHANKALSAGTIYKWTWPILIWALIALFVVIIPYVMICG